MKIVKIKNSCGNGNGCSVTEYVMPNSVKVVDISAKKNLVKKAV
jgi:hypothetical protein